MSEDVDLGRRHFLGAAAMMIAAAQSMRRFRESTVRLHTRDFPLVMGRRSEDRAGA
jgi:hypothetical protein